MLSNCLKKLVKKLPSNVRLKFMNLASKHCNPFEALIRDYDYLVCIFRDLRVESKHFENEFFIKYNRGPDIDDINERKENALQYKEYGNCKRVIEKYFNDRYKKDYDKIILSIEIKLRQKRAKKEIILSDSEDNIEVSETVPHTNKEIENVELFINKLKDKVFPIIKQENKCPTNNSLPNPLHSNSIIQGQEDNDEFQQYNNKSMENTIEEMIEAKCKSSTTTTEETPELSFGRSTDELIDNEQEDLYAYDSSEEISKMDLPPPPSFNKIFTETPLYWKHIMQPYIYPKDHVKYMDKKVMKRAYRIRKIMEDFTVKHFNDLINDKQFRINRLTSYPYNKQFTPYSFKRTLARIRGFKTRKEILKEGSDIPHWMFLRGYFNGPRSHNPNIKTNFNNNIEVPIYPWSFEDEYQAKLDPYHYRFKFALKEKDPEYIKLMGEIFAEQEGKRIEEQNKSKLRKPRKKVDKKIITDLKDSDLVSTNFVKMNTKKGKFRTGISKPNNPSKSNKSNKSNNYRFNYMRNRLGK